MTELEDKLDEDELFYRFNTVRAQRSFRLRELGSGRNNELWERRRLGSSQTR